MTDYVNVVISAWFMVLLVLVIIWSTVWKALALWRSARNKQVVWFIVILLLNTIGILEIIYLAFFQRNKNTAIPVVVKTRVKPAKKKVVRKKKKK